MDEGRRAELRRAVELLVRAVQGGATVAVQRDGPTEFRITVTSVGDEPPLPTERVLALNVLVGDPATLPNALADFLMDRDVQPADEILFPKPEVETVSPGEWSPRRQTLQEHEDYIRPLRECVRLIRRIHGRPLNTLCRHIQRVYDRWTGLFVPRAVGERRGTFRSQVPTRRFFTQQLATMPSPLRVFRHIRATSHSDLPKVSAAVLLRCIAAIESGSPIGPPTEFQG